jgi:ADP-heptose:LPS heptosyltransferase
MEEMEKVENIEEAETVQESEAVEVSEQVEAIESPEKKKALLIKLSSLGDVVFNIPLANALKDAGYEVTWLVSERGIQVVENNPCVDKVILAPIQKWRKRGLKFENFKEYFTLINQLREEKFDIAIDSQMILKSMVWTMFCGAKRRIIAKDAREGSIIGGNEWIEKIFDKANPIVLNYLKFATHFDCFPSEIKVTLPPRSEMVVKKVDNLLADVDKTKPFTRELKGIAEDDVKEKLYSEFGSKQRLNRDKIIFDEIIEINADEVTDPVVKDLL